MTLAFARYIVRPADGEGGPSSWMQQPFLRLVGQGPAWVALFFILSGFVNALKPVKLARSGNIESALSNLAISSFRRPFRLFLPATATTIISWFITQFGAYETARRSDAYWLYITSPSPSPTWGKAFEDLLTAIRTTWLYEPGTPYDQPQWALLFLLQGSMFVFTALLITINLTPRFRVFAIVVCYFWSMNWSTSLSDRMSSDSPISKYSLLTIVSLTAMVGTNVFTGILLVELNYSKYTLLLSRYSAFFTPPLAILGLFLMSFPSHFQSWAPWSNFLLQIFHDFAPANADLARFWPTIGAQLLTFTIVLSPHLRRVLSHKSLLWLGKISFPLYLLHGSFMRSILSYMLFAQQDLTTVEDGGSKFMRYPQPGIATFVVVMPVFLVVLFTASHVWSEKVEPCFAWMTACAEEKMFGRQERPTVLPLKGN